MTTTERGPRIRALLVVALISAPALAESPRFEAEPLGSLSVPESPERDSALRSDAAATDSRAPEGSRLDPAFAHLPSPVLPAPLDVVGTYAASYASTDGAARPLAALARQSGFVSELGAELGVLPRLSLSGVARLAPPRDGERSGSAAGQGALRLAITDPDARSFRLIAGAGYARDFGAVSAPFIDLTATVDIQRVRIASHVRGEKALDTGRDAVDLVAASGISVRTLDVLRVGAEYVGQDFEDAWEPEEAEGGVRHFAGLTVAVAPSERVSIVGGPALGLSEASPRLVGRVALSALF